MTVKNQRGFTEILLHRDFLSWRDYLQPLSKKEFRKGCSRLNIELEYLFINQTTVHAPKTKIDHL